MALSPRKFFGYQLVSRVAYELVTEPATRLRPPRLFGAIAKFEFRLQAMRRARFTCGFDHFGSPISSIV
jgi:hypothetical protein